MKVTTTIVTCDRCLTEKRYDHQRSSVLSEELRSEWAYFWPASVSQVNGSPNATVEPQTICHDCLTEDELAELTRQRELDEIPW